MKDTPGIRFPNESQSYRDARNELLHAELELRRQIEQVAARRGRLPIGGVVPEDYSFDEAIGGAVRAVTLSELFGDKKSLVIYSFMYGPSAENPCTMCTSFLDSLDGAARHLGQRLSLAVVAKSPIARILAFARDRGWSHLRLLSSSRNDYQADYRGELDGGKQWPMMNVFVRRDDAVHHFYGSEVLYADGLDAVDQRHNDLMWPLWNVLDLTPEGRGTDWYPELSYAE